MPSITNLRLRANLNRLIREFFHTRNVLEVETPILSVAGNTDPNIESLWLDGSVRDEFGRTRRWLRTSPEFAQKRLLAAGVGDCYEIARVFRRGERGRRHNPEFTLLEWYRLGFDHRRLIDEVVELLHGAFRLVGRDLRVEVASYADWFLRTTGIDPHRAADAELEAALAGFDVRAADLARDDWLNLLLTHRVEPALPRDTVVALYDFPASQASWRSSISRRARPRSPGYDRGSRRSPSASRSTSTASSLPTAITSSPRSPSSAADSRATSRPAEAAAASSPTWTRICWRRWPRGCRTAPAWRWDSTGC